MNDSVPIFRLPIAVTASQAVSLGIQLRTTVNGDAIKLHYAAGGKRDPDVRLGHKASRGEWEFELGSVGTAFELVGRGREGCGRGKCTWRRSMPGLRRRGGQ